MITTDEESSLSFQGLGSIFRSKLPWMNTPSKWLPTPCNASQHWKCQWPTPSIFLTTVDLCTLAFQNGLYVCIWGLGLPVTQSGPYISVRQICETPSVKKCADINFIPIVFCSQFCFPSEFLNTCMHVGFLIFYGISGGILFWALV